jgi:effector-binding domain-containing protein
MVDEPDRETPVIYDVDIVAVPEQAVISVRARGPLPGMGRRVARLRELVAQAGLTPAGPLMARFYEHDPASPTLDYDVALPVELRSDGSVPDELAEARGELVPLHHALQAVHAGPHDALQGAWRAVQEAREALGYTASGPVTEVYVLGRNDGVEPARFVTEVRLPYAR